MENSSFERRKILIEEMRRNESQGNHCMDCTGKCCTFVANSMQITSLEAEEIAEYLRGQESHFSVEQWISHLRKNVTDFGLNREVSTKGNRGLRRTYTCPFYNFLKPGCGIPVRIKPYGCLAFNPTTTGVTDGGQCTSNTSLLAEREKAWAHKEVLNSFEKSYEINKLPIPLAILKVLEKTY